MLVPAPYVKTRLYLRDQFVQTFNRFQTSLVLFAPGKLFRNHVTTVRRSKVWGCVIHILSAVKPPRKLNECKPIGNCVSLSWLRSKTFTSMEEFCRIWPRAKWGECKCLRPSQSARNQIRQSSFARARPQCGWSAITWHTSTLAKWRPLNPYCTFWAQWVVFHFPFLVFQKKQRKRQSKSCCVYFWGLCCCVQIYGENTCSTWVDRWTKLPDRLHVHTVYCKVHI